MIICGLKLTHDGTVALLDGDELVFSVEMEKLANAPRYAAIEDLKVVPRVLADFGYAVTDVHEWVIDGWSDAYSLPRLNGGEPIAAALGPYRETATAPDLFRSSVRGTLPIGDRTVAYQSYPHAAGHAASVYATSPFATRGESSYVLVWDGAMFPRLYLVEPARGATGLGVLFPLIGHSYALMAQHFGPFRHGPKPPPFNDLTVAGKLMAYIALGKPQESLLEVLRQAFHERFEDDSRLARLYRVHAGSAAPFIQASMPPLREFFETVGAEAQRMAVPDEDVLASVHQFMQDLLVERITTTMVAARPDGPRNLCFGGGCALNIKWNSALRALPLVDQMWIPPFPNDSGSAIGAAALGRFRHEGVGPIRWHTRLGPALRTATGTPQGWSATLCDVAQLARELHVTGSPVIVLHGRAELGPRALGGRSILAAATRSSMRDELNRIKGREHYRPVAPACLVERAQEIFDPGTPDPHMLFDHAVRRHWAHRIPAVVHLDGSARLQTVGPDDPFLHEVLREYNALSGIPVLCNTSANFNGSGFFPDLDSAMRWGQVDRIWCDGRLYRRVIGH
jgi:carbamoyltransferase